ncbi:hypothetical protein LTR62_006799 [Meristemomyces frigidus]|uniref:BRCT domain-containing protein n=1 Tax=Meristemomyces frigidus TaxID=1508187 RepID=A0AAN7YMQ9_9PEZI|nr:hypothetical protein LTR62_006799 [Meristemomyces frigidus]
MVSTRRTAQTEPSADMVDADLNNTLRKKPVRKASAKKAETDAKPIIKTTRGRKATIQSGEAVEGDIISTLQAKKAPGRPKKAVDEQAVEKVATVSRPAKSARTTALRSKRTEVLLDEQTNDVSYVKAPGGRQTRAEKAQVERLSPKKITQVAKTRASKTDTCAPAAKVVASAQTTARPISRATRARVVSDENAILLDQAVEAEEEEDVAVALNTPTKIASPAKCSTRKRADSEHSMSSRGTTPSASLAPTFDALEDEEEKIACKQGSESEDELAGDDSEVFEGSDDELCGPKTPMKRTSPGASARYQASARKAAQEYDNTMAKIATPKLLEPIHDATTPKTQGHRSMLSLLRSPEYAMTASRTRGERLGGSVLCTDPDYSVQVPGTPVVDTVGAEGEDGETTHVDDNLMQYEAIIEEDKTTVSEHEVPPPTSTGPQKICDDPDETILVDGEESASDIPSGDEDEDPFATEDTVLVVAQDAKVAHPRSDDNEASVLPPSPTPETMIWDNIRLDLTVPINFDAHFQNVTLAPAYSGIETGAIDKDSSHFGLNICDAPLSTNATEPDDLHDDSLLIDGLEDEIADEGTVDFRDFLNVNALAEYTQAMDSPPAAQSADAEDGSDSDATVLISEQPVEEAEPDFEVPHYARPTIAFDARRKSLPVFNCQTPTNVRSRPNTSDGASMPRMPLVFHRPWVATPGSRRQSVVQTAEDKAEQTPTLTPIKRRESLVAGVGTIRVEEHAKTIAGPPRYRTPMRQIKNHSATVKRMSADAITPRASTLRPRNIAAAAATISTPKIDDESETSFALETPTTHNAQERYPLLSHRKPQHDQAQTVAPPARFQTPIRRSPRRPATVSKMAAQTSTSQKPGVRQEVKQVTPQALPQATTAVISTPVVQSERFPRLAARSTYTEHAKTVSAPRFSTPLRSPAKRPSTTQKQGSLHKTAVANSTSVATRTPVKTPLKPPAMTPGQVPMTPHPSAPLRAIVAMVEIYTLEGASTSAPFTALLHRLGAKTTKTWNDRVTHVVFKDGSPTTLQRVRLHNKGVAESGDGSPIYCVNSRWISDCDTQGRRVEETDDEYVVDVTEVPRGGGRRRKSMEPSALINLGGNIIRDHLRKSSIGRSSLGRSQPKFAEQTPAKLELNVSVSTTPEAPSSQESSTSDKENESENENELADVDQVSSPATPAYLAAPEKLVQQTAPLNRMRKLEPKAKEAGKMRRLTYFNGGA